MRTSKFSESRIVAILKEAEAGVPVAEVTRKHGIARATYFAWKAKYANATVSELTRLRELEQGPAAVARRAGGVRLVRAAGEQGAGGAHVRRPADLLARGPRVDGRDLVFGVGVARHPDVDRGAGDHLHVAQVRAPPDAEHLRPPPVGGRGAGAARRSPVVPVPR